MKGQKPLFFKVKDTDFRVSSYSDPGGVIKTCVAVAVTKQGVAMRYTKNPQGKTLFFNHAEWSAFLKGVKNGEFGQPA